jgi:hypothetical protein
MNSERVILAIPGIVGQTLGGGVSKKAQRVEEDGDVVSSGAEVEANQMDGASARVAR